MREPERMERILNLIKEIWSKQPDSRLMQLMSNISWDYATMNGGKYIDYTYSKFENEKGVQFLKDMANVDLFYVEDDKFEEFLENYLKKS